MVALARGEGNPISARCSMTLPRSTRWVLAIAVLCSAVAAGAAFVGPESSRGGPPEAYAAWRSSKHARSMESLTAEQQREARCPTCHAPNLADQSMAGIGCETCHGGGQYYAPAYVMK